ncbi:glycosyltransferase family 4 protein [Micromonospora marina]|uniref:Glycosyltransferase involved in cell wall bisynthesis n=1 Tax=Micromonospora marina TaxID=307120 RepID=A0A1C4ZKZ9_9ACTN|nr:glycosyltransferase family 4 protein [Micromonospora marina]SCF33777.1 Glycosyltransferase involved in cell wall bisynthesis [Micromonospora marina]
MLDTEMPERMRVCVVGPLPPPVGGIARGVAMLVDRFRDDPEVRIEVIDIARRWRGGQGLGWGRRLTAGVRQLTAGAVGLRRVLAAGRTDVVHLHSSGGPGVLRDLALLRIARVYRRPAVYHLHFGRIPEIAGRRSLEWRLMVPAMRLATAVLVLDGASESTVRDQLPTVWVLRMPNGVDLDRLPVPHRDPAPAERTVLFVGWLLHAKGVEDLLTAWRTAAQPGWRLLFVGPADPAYLRSVTVRHQPSASVSFMGELPHTDVLAMMARCDLFVLPSHTEGFPNVIVEAMALGCPVVATDVGATAEILDDDSGVIVAPSDPAGLAAALRELMTDPVRRADLAGRARARVHRLYGLQRVLRQHIDLWRRLAGPPRPDHRPPAAAPGKHPVGS